MSIEDMNTKYLRVGYRRRDENQETGRTTAKGRPVMGGKSLGKLSLFSIANTIEVHSARNGETHGLRMTIDGIHKSVQVMETRLTKVGVLTQDMTEKEKLGHVDIAYRTMAGKHIIVELKRVRQKMKLLELQEQGQTYVDKLKKILLSR